MFPLTPDQHHWLEVATEDEGWCSFTSCTPSRSREWPWDILQLTCFEFERSKVKVAGSQNAKTYFRRSSGRRELCTLSSAQPVALTDNVMTADWPCINCKLQFFPVCCKKGKINSWTVSYCLNGCLYVQYVSGELLQQTRRWRRRSSRTVLNQVWVIDTVIHFHVY